MCRGVSISSKMAPFTLEPLRLASWRSHPERSQFWKNKQQGNVSQVCRSSVAGLHVSVCTYLQVCASECGPSQVAVLQFGVFQRGHSQIDSCHLTSFHVYALKVGSYNPHPTYTHNLISVLQHQLP